MSIGKQLKATLKDPVSRRKFGKRALFTICSAGAASVFSTFSYETNEAGLLKDDSDYYRDRLSRVIFGLYRDVEGLTEAQKKQNAIGVTDYVLKKIVPNWGGDVRNGLVSTLIHEKFYRSGEPSRRNLFRFGSVAVGDVAVGGVASHVANQVARRMTSDDVLHLKNNYAFPEDQVDLLNHYIGKIMQSADITRYLGSAFINTAANMWFPETFDLVESEVDGTNPEEAQSAPTPVPEA